MAGSRRQNAQGRPDEAPTPRLAHAGAQARGAVGRVRIQGSFPQGDFTVNKPAQSKRRVKATVICYFPQVRGWRTQGGRGRVRLPRCEAATAPTAFTRRSGRAGECGKPSSHVGGRGASPRGLWLSTWSLTVPWQHERLHSPVTGFQSHVGATRLPKASSWHRHLCSGGRGQSRAQPGFEVWVEPQVCPEMTT